MQNDLIFLREKADWVWRRTLELHKDAPEIRIASSLSAVEIFSVLYYGNVLNYFPHEPLHPGRDRLIVSKGHGSISMYPILADLGFFPMEELSRVCRRGSFLGGIPDPVIPGYETVNGSLGHGLGVAAGIALGCAHAKRDSAVFVVCGDGELQEGANWEAIMFASHHRLDNLNLIVDDNAISMLGRTAEIVNHGDLAKRLDAFGWDVAVADGHDTQELLGAFFEMKGRHKGRPKAVIAKTIKGHRVPGLENAPLSHIMSVKPNLIDELLRKP